MREGRLSHQIVICFILALVLCSFLSLTGCVTFWKSGPPKESRVDAELMKPVPPSAPSTAATEEPQPGFAQEPSGARNS